jgi:ERF superfamily protein
MTEAAIVTRRESTLARVDPQALILKAIETGAGIETMERLVELAKEVRAITAREAWFEAMAKFQEDCPQIIKNKMAKIPTRGGGTFEYRYASLDSIVAAVQPVMAPLGLTISWRTPRIERDHVVAACVISHQLGHTESSGEVTMPIVQGEGGATPPQRVGIALTYAKRYALLGILGLAPEDDDDASDHGRPSTPEPAHDAPAAQQTMMNPDDLITQRQLNRLSAIASGAKWTEEQIHELIKPYESRKDIRVADYEAICDTLKTGYAAWKAAKS